MKGYSVSEDLPTTKVTGHRPISRPLTLHTPPPQPPPASAAAAQFLIKTHTLRETHTHSTQHIDTGQARTVQDHPTISCQVL